MTAPPASALRVVVRFLDKRLLKGTTHDFHPNKPDFHVHPEGDEKAAPVKVGLAPLKAVFFVKSLTGDRDHVEDKSFLRAKGQGRRIKVTFKDGEEIVGFTVGYAPNRPGFFLIPSDPDSNNLRVFVVTSAVTKVEMLPMMEPSMAGAAAR